MPLRIPARFVPRFLLFWLLTAGVYALAWRSGFERDFHGWLELFYYRSFPDAINRKGSAITSLYQGTQLQLWLWTVLFGTAKVPWFLLMTGLHAAATASASRFFEGVFEDFRVAGSRWIAFWGGVLFLLMPSAAEVVVWKASYHYPVAVLLCIGVLDRLRAHLHRGGARPLLAAFGLYLLSTFTLELFYATLPLAALLVAAYRIGNRCTPDRARTAVVGGLLPLAGAFLLHFLLYRLVYGGGLPHAQALVQDALRHPTTTLGRALADEFHLLLQGRYWPGELRQAAYRVTARPLAGWIAGAGLLALAVLAVRRLVQGRGGAALVLAGALGGLLLMVQYPVPDLGIYYNDRWLYFTGLFQWLLVAGGLARLRRHLRTALLGVLLLALTGCTAYTALQCRRAARVFWAAIDGFRWKGHRGPILVLNMPSNLDAIPIILATPQFDEFNSHLRIFTGDSGRNRIQTVAGYNLFRWWDGANVARPDARHLRAALDGWGTWWWNGTLGASDHENDLYRVRFTAPGYQLELKDTTVLLLRFQGGAWQEVGHETLAPAMVR